MPGVRDKVIINNNGLKSFWLICKGWFKGIAKVLVGSKKLSKEIKKNGWLYESECEDFLLRQEESCKRVDEAHRLFISELSAFHDDQNKLNDDMRRYIDKKNKEKLQVP